MNCNRCGKPSALLTCDGVFCSVACAAKVGTGFFAAMSAGSVRKWDRVILTAKGNA
jgi:hypothetical protein